DARQVMTATSVAPRAKHSNRPRRPRVRPTRRRDLVGLGVFAFAHRLGPAALLTVAELFHDLALLGGLEEYELGGVKFASGGGDGGGERRRLVPHRRRKTPVRRQRRRRQFPRRSQL